MREPLRKIAVVQGVPSAEVQTLFRAFVERWRSRIRLAGVISEDHGLPDRACTAGYLRSLTTGEKFQIFQDLGAGSKGCHLAADGALAAAHAVQRDIVAGCDLVVLSKFGSLERKGSGLRDAFSAAIEAGIPVLTSVSPAYIEAWDGFAAPWSVIMPADAGRIDAWWQSVRSPAVAMAGSQADRALHS
jgi:hypothetical protein